MKLRSNRLFAWVICVFVVSAFVIVGGSWLRHELQRAKTDPTALQSASQRCDVRTVEAILADELEDPNDPDSWVESTPMDIATRGTPLVAERASEYDCVETLQTLLNYGADPFVRLEGDSLLYRAVWAGQSDLRVFQWLDDQGLSVCDAISDSTKKDTGKERLSEFVSASEAELVSYLSDLEQSCP